MLEDGRSVLVQYQHDAILIEGHRFAFPRGEHLTRALRLAHSSRPRPQPLLDILSEKTHLHVSLAQSLLKLAEGIGSFSR